MTRSLVGIAAGAMITFAPMLGAAEPAPTPRVAVSRQDGRVTFAMRTQGLTVTQTVTPSTFFLTMSEGKDVTRITGDVRGQLTLVRAGRTVALSMATATPADAAATRATLAGSRALAEFDRVMASPWARSATDALVFASAHAIVSLLRGDAAPLKAVVDRVRRASEPRLMSVAQRTASECWRAYESDVVRYTYELEACLAEASESFNPLRGAWCAYSYNLKATLAFVWLLDCSGY